MTLILKRDFEKTSFPVHSEPGQVEYHARRYTYETEDGNALPMVQLLSEFKRKHDGNSDIRVDQIGFISIEDEDCDIDREQSRTFKVTYIHEDLADDFENDYAPYFN